MTARLFRALIRANLAKTSSNKAQHFDIDTESLRPAVKMLNHFL